MNKILDLSILIITYNQENSISKTLDSILSQEHSYSYEIIVGDDCSLDNTRKIISEYVEKYPSIIKPIFNDTNLGIVKNYFNVFSFASGKYIMECAGDDWWLPGKIVEQISFMENNSEVGMCYGKAKEFIDKLGAFSDSYVGRKTESFQDLLESNEIPALTVCYRRDIALKYIEVVNPLSKNWLMEDYPMWLWFSVESKIRMLSNFFGVYRVLDTSGSHFTNVEKFKRFQESVWDVKSFYNDTYLNKDLGPLNIHADLSYLYLLNGNRKMALREACLSKGKKKLLKQLICSIPFLFYLYRKIKCLKV